MENLRREIERWALAEGFSGVGVTELELQEPVQRLDRWLEADMHGEMGWMATQRDLRARPDLLLPGALRAICFRMPYLAEQPPVRINDDPDRAVISHYARGRDYHKLIRRKLARIAALIEDWSESNLNQRAFVDSAPVLEKPLASSAGLGWIGKNTLLLSQKGGSWFFLGEILTDLPLPVDTTTETDQCGKCRACLSACPTDAFPAPYVLDARRCISYLTIEHPGAIPTELRVKMGNRVFGCDDCQLVCPWNREATLSTSKDFQPRHGLDQAKLIDLFEWTEERYLERTAGSPMRRAGFERWQRNLAVGLGNGPATPETMTALQSWHGDSALVREHVEWAINQLQQRSDKS